MTVCRYIKSATRSRLRDVLASATLHLQQLRNYIDVENLQPTDSLVLDFQRALDRVENSLLSAGSNGYESNSQARKSA